ANEETEKKPQRPQSKEENSKFARQRREAEQKAKIEKAREEARIEAIINFAKTNKFTGEKLEDAEDVALYEAMIEYEANGGDPVDDMAKIFKSLKAKTKAETESKASQQEQTKKDIEEFKKAYPNADLNSLLADSRFEKFAKWKLGNMPLSEIYADYQELFQVSKTNETKKETVAKPSVGALKGQSSNAPKYLTIEQIKNMSDEEIEENYDLVKKSLQKKK
ncbi:MAG: hypothetical protein ACI4MY_06580, partial [Christensenellales bacterium]